MAFVSSKNKPTFQPAERGILSITQDSIATIVTTYDGVSAANHDYGTGLVVRIYVPRDWGMTQLDKEVFAITVVDDTSFTIPIDTTNFDAFVVPASSALTAQVVPIGEITSICDQATRNVLPYK